METEHDSIVAFVHPIALQPCQLFQLQTVLFQIA